MHQDICVVVSDPVLQARGFLLLSVPFFPKIKILTYLIMFVADHHL